jgi:hypothetical protein
MEHVARLSAKSAALPNSVAGRRMGRRCLVLQSNTMAAGDPHVQENTKALANRSEKKV